MEIELKTRKVIYGDMIGSIFSVPCIVNNDSIRSIENLKSFVEPVGIKVRLEQTDEEARIFFEVDVKKYKRVVWRNAGRKSDTTMAKKYKKCKVSELKVKLETMKKNEIIAELGCPKSTFYRILKNVNFRNSRIQNRQIWDFTSENKARR